MNPISLLFIALGVLTVLFVGYWIRTVIRAKTGLQFPTLLEICVGFVVNFFDTLGIGMYAPTTSIFKLKRMVDDRLIPGTLNVGSSLTGVLQTFIIVALIAVDARTLLLMIVAATLGAWLGAGVVANLPKRTVQIGMGMALIVSATLMLLSLFHLLPAGGDAIGVTGAALAFAVLVNFILGALMTLGIGMYAPSMIMVSLLGMSPKAAFPIMMGSCAFLVPVASIRFIRENSYALRPALGLTLGGIPAILIAAFLVREMPLVYIRWVVIVVVLYAAISMLRSAFAVSEIPAETQLS